MYQAAGQAVRDGCGIRYQRAGLPLAAAQEWTDKLPLVAQQRAMVERFGRVDLIACRPAPWYPGRPESDLGNAAGHRDQHYAVRLRQASRPRRRLATCHLQLSLRLLAQLCAGAPPAYSTALQRPGVVIAAYIRRAPPPAGPDLLSPAPALAMRVYAFGRLTRTPAPPAPDTGVPADLPLTSVPAPAPAAISPRHPRRDLLPLGQRQVPPAPRPPAGGSPPRQPPGTTPPPAPANPAAAAARRSRQTAPSPDTAHRPSCRRFAQQTSTERPDAN